jgi:hypothetical protein
MLKDTPPLPSTLVKDRLWSRKINKDAHSYSVRRLPRRQYILLTEFLEQAQGVRGGTLSEGSGKQWLAEIQVLCQAYMSLLNRTGLSYFRIKKSWLNQIRNTTVDFGMTITPEHLDLSRF